MKKILFLFFTLVLLGGCTSCPTVVHWNTDANCAFKEAQQKNKPVLLLITQPDCSACENCWYTVFGEEDFVTDVSEFCVPLYKCCPFPFEGECKKYRALPDADKSPSLILLDKEGKHLKTFSYPYGNKEKCLAEIKKAVEK